MTSPANLDNMAKITCKLLKFEFPNQFLKGASSLSIKMLLRHPRFPNAGPAIRPVQGLPKRLQMIRQGG